MAPAVSKNRGYSLIELMVASTISLIALGFVSSVFLSGYKLNSQRSLELMVAQDLNDTLKMMKEDIVRAGYNEGMRSSFVITGTDPSMVVHLSPPPPAIASCISYGYFDGVRKYYRSYYKSNNRLNVLTSET
ncbi:PilW family protein, partial [Photobacterium sanguinicancri]